MQARIKQKSKLGVITYKEREELTYDDFMWKLKQFEL